MRKPITLLSAMVIAMALSSNVLSQSDWTLTGNANATTSSKLGTTTAIPLRLFTGNVERIRILAAGNVGIGTTAPAQKLHVVGHTYITGNLGVGTASPGGKLHVVGNAIISGRLGIGGSSSSTYALNVHGTSSLGGVNVPNAYSNYILFGTKNGTGPGVFSYSSSNQNTSASVYGYNSGPGYGVMGYIPGLQYSVSDPNAPAAVYGYNAGVGYGTGGYCENGSGVYGYSKTYVGVYGQTANASSYAGFFAGRVFSTGGFIGSDEKLKRNIAEVKDAMSIINQLQPKTYEYRQDGNYKLMNFPEGSHYGFVAQDVEKVLPHLVKATEIDTKMLTAAGKPDKDGNQIPSTVQYEKIEFKAVNYTEMIPVVVGGMQELSKENEQLRVQLKLQQAQIDELKVLIQSLQKGAGAMSDVKGYLKQNAPNPFNDNSIISYYAPTEAMNVQLVISDMKGRVLQSYTGSKGDGQVTINRAKLPAGVYSYSLVIDSKVADTKKLVIQ